MKKNTIFYLIATIIFILLFIYINNQIHININYKVMMDTKNKISNIENLKKKLLLEYYANYDLINIENKAKLKHFVIKNGGDYQIIIDEKR